MTPLKTQENTDTTHPIVILFGIVILATVLTYFVSSGTFEREGRLVVPGSYTQIEKSISPSSLFSTGHADESVAHPVSIIGMLMAIPEGLEKTSGLIFMVLIIGGMFGILTRSGAIEAGLERLVSGVKGNIYLLTAGLMILFSAGSTFLGLASEYLLIIPLMTTLANRFGLSNLIGLAIITVGAKIGYLSSVTNPIPLTIAQPLLGLQIFSGSEVRFIFYLVFLAIGIAFMFWVIKRTGVKIVEGSLENGVTLSGRQKIILLTLAIGVAFLVYGANTWQWKHHELSAYYIGLSLVLALVSGMGPSQSARAFVAGMKDILMASFLIGIASAVSVVLAKGQILDSVVFGLTSLIGDSGPYVATYSMFISQLMLDFIIPSTSGQAAVSMPILGPIGQLTGVPAQTTVLAFLFGNGLTNMITPTSGTLLAYLATAKINWIDWFKFILPLWFLFSGVSIVLLTVAVIIGF